MQSKPKLGLLSFDEIFKDNNLDEKWSNKIERSLLENNYLELVNELKSNFDSLTKTAQEMLEMLEILTNAEDPQTIAAHELLQHTPRLKEKNTQTQEIDTHG